MTKESGISVVTYLIILGSQLVQAFLNDMVTVQVFNQNNYVEAKCNNDRMYLSVVSMIGLLFTCKLDKKKFKSRMNLPGGVSTRNRSSFEQREYHAC